MSKIQSVIFSRDIYTVAAAKKWLKSKGLKYGKVDKKVKTLRFRQLDPGFFKYFRVKTVAPNIKLVFGFNRKRPRKTKT